LHELVVVWPGNFFFDLGWSYALSIVASSLPQQEFGRAIIESNISDASTGGCASGVAGKGYWKLLPPPWVTCYSKAVLPYLKLC